MIAVSTRFLIGSPVLLVVLACCAAVAELSSTSLNDVTQSVALDLHGDPLPDGAVARLGTARLRALCGSIHFAPDGKTLVGIDAGRVVRTWDAISGSPRESHILPGRPERSRW